MSSKQQYFKEGQEALISIIGDVDTVTGFLLAGVGNVSHVNDQANFLIVNDSTAPTVVENAFKQFSTTKNIAIILITQKVAEDYLRHLLATYDKPFPAVLEIPSKDDKYDPSKDFILQKLKAFGGN
eukprot:gene10321-2737_t